MNQSFEKSNSPISREETNTTIFNGFNLGTFSGKNLLIVILTILLIFSFLGINLLVNLGNFLQSIVVILTPLLTQILSIFGYTAGTILDKTEDVATSVAKTGIDIAGGTVQSVADLLKKGSISNVDSTAALELDKSLSGGFDRELNEKKVKQPEFKYNEPKPDSSTHSIQKPITSDKSVWCLVGEYQGKRGCVEVDDANKCLSGQVFPNKQMCLYPTKTVYMHSHAA
jgi:hypothetical protein